MSYPSLPPPSVEDNPKEYGPEDYIYDPTKEEQDQRVSLDYMRNCIINPVLDDFMPIFTDKMDIQLDRKFWENLLLGTAAQESNFLNIYRDQAGGGPGRGLFQIELDTHDDLWDSYFSVSTVRGNLIKENYLQGEEPTEYDLKYNDRYGAAIALNYYVRVFDNYDQGKDFNYFEDVLADVDPDDPAELANIWKLHYNTSSGAGTEQNFIDNWDRYIDN